MAQSADPIRVAVITGGHSFDVVHFQQLFRSLSGVDAYIQHLDDFTSSSEEVRKWYDVVLFYTFLEEDPQDEDIPWYAGQPKSVLLQLGSTSQGIVILHHALGSYPKWQTWRDITGIDAKIVSVPFNETLPVQVANPDPPITRGLSDWSIVDEIYAMSEPDPSCNILLTTDHPHSMPHIAWTRQYRNARVFCFQSGHDQQTWVDENFRQVLHRGIGWCANRL